MVKNLLRKRQDATALPDNRAETGKIQTFVSKITRNGNTRGTPCKPLAPSDTSVFSSAMTLYLQQPPSKIWRRERDSNPRWVAPHLISSQAQSTTLSSLRSDSLIECDCRAFGKLNQQNLQQTQCAIDDYQGIDCAS